ncbi:hypothetical protein BH24PSE2_BH24PSE2_21890 [soil metagenome]
MRSAVVLACTSLLATACAARAPEAPISVPPPVAQTGLSEFLTDLRKLSGGDPAVTAEIHERAVIAVEDAATTTNRLRLALVLGQPGHPATDPTEAQRMLNELLAAPDSLQPDERALAAIHLQEIEERLILEAENRRLHARVAEATSRQDAENEERLRRALEENRRLRKALGEAQSKLEAVTSIERDIRERDENGELP